MQVCVICSNQLYEYVSLRRGQSKLLELSQQRQSFRYAPQIDFESTVSRPREPTVTSQSTVGVTAGGIRAFLVPKVTPSSVAQVRRTSELARISGQGAVCHEM